MNIKDRPERQTTARPKVSVCVVTYNQAPYIAKCLQSLVTQETTFPFEIIVGDDASTDGTSDIVRRFVQQYPDRVRALLHDKNLGPFENYRATHLAATGDFVAHVDGDDYALKGKLQTQADILDADPSASGTFHRLQMVDANGHPTGRHWPEGSPERFGLEYLVLHHPVVGHSSMMYRRGRLDGLLHANDRFIDFRIYVELAKVGDLTTCQDVLGAYTTNVGISRTNKWLPEIMAAVETAAVSGISENVIRRAKANHLFRAALNEFYAENYTDFRALIETSMNIERTSIAQTFFYHSRLFPKFIRTIDAIYKRFRQIGLMRDIKLDHR